jgi:DNA-binding phage protein
MSKVASKKNISPVDILQLLEKRRRELGMPMVVLAKRADLGARTVQRTLSGEADAANLGTVTKIANALGVSFVAKFDEEMPQRAALQKATALANLVQGTSALEGQGVDSRVLRQITDQLKYKLLSGSRAKLWHE